MRLKVPSTEPDGRTSLLTELDDPQPIGPAPLGSKEGSWLGSVGVALDEGTVTTAALVIVRPMICVVDLVVTIMVTELLINVVSGRVVRVPLLDSTTETGTGNDVVGELMVRVSTTGLVRFVTSCVEE